MTTEDIDKLEAGRELDALVAQRVFPDDVFRWHSRCDYSGCFRCLHNCEHYSTDIAAAWLVVERFRELRYAFSLDDRGDRLWDCYFQLDSTDYSSGCLGVDAAPLAICRAALKVVHQ